MRPNFHTSSTGWKPIPRFSTNSPERVQRKGNPRSGERGYRFRESLANDRALTRRSHRHNSDRDITFDLAVSIDFTAGHDDRTDS